MKNTRFGTVALNNTDHVATTVAHLKRNQLAVRGPHRHTVRLADERNLARGRAVERTDHQSLGVCDRHRRSRVVALEAMLG